MRKNTSPIVMCAAVAALLAACAEEALDPVADDATDFATDDETGATGDEVMSEVPEEWEFIGYGEVCEDCEPSAVVMQEAAAVEPEIDDVAADVEDPDGVRKMVAFNPETREEFVVELPTELVLALRDAAQAEGGALGKVPDDFDVLADTGDEHGAPGAGDARLTDEAPTLPGWSDGTDTRDRKFNNTTFPYRAMGQINGGSTSGCSGTLVGPRHVATAAHCLWDNANRTWFPFTFRPGREGTCSGTGCQPYGAHGITWYFTPWEYRVAGKSQTYYNRHDYGFAVTQNRPGDLTGGWLGMIALGQSSLKSHCSPSIFSAGCRNRGYPACGFVENSNTPDGCVQGWAYEDVNACRIGSFPKQYGSDGWRSQFKTSCDMGRGHSGSATYSYWYGTPVVTGVASYQNCSTCGSSDDYPNGMRRVTPHVIDWYLYFRNRFQ